MYVRGFIRIVCFVCHFSTIIIIIIVNTVIVLLGSSSLLLDHILV
jgi:hypothetical protein